MQFELSSSPIMHMLSRVEQILYTNNHLPPTLFCQFYHLKAWYSVFAKYFHAIVANIDI